MIIDVKTVSSDEVLLLLNPRGFPISFDYMMYRLYGTDVMFQKL